MQNPPLSPPAMTPYAQPPASQYTYAGFWVRLVARLLDTLIVGIPLAVILGLLLGVAAAIGSASSTTDNSGNSGQSAAAALVGVLFIVFYLLVIAVSIGYWVYFWGTTGQTYGMRMLRLRVVDANTGAPIGIARALVRWLMTIVNSWACYVGWIWVAFDARKQGWHDKVANSVVLQG